MHVNTWAKIICQNTKCLHILTKCVMWICKKFFVEQKGFDSWWFCTSFYQYNNSYLMYHLSFVLFSLSLLWNIWTDIFVTIFKHKKVLFFSFFSNWISIENKVAIGTQYKLLCLRFLEWIVIHLFSGQLIQNPFFTIRVFVYFLKIKFEYKLWLY